MTEPESKEALQRVRLDFQRRLEQAREHYLQGLEQLAGADRAWVARVFAEYEASQAGRGFAREAEATHQAAKYFQVIASGETVQTEDALMKLNQLAEDLFQSDERALER